VNYAVAPSALFTDKGILDTHTAVWDWGDGSTSSGIVTETNGTGSVSGTHAYAMFGVYTVGLTVTDKDGGSGQSTFQIVVKANPTITWNNPADVTYGTALSGTQLNATSSVEGSFVYTPAEGTTLNVGSNQTLSVTFTPKDTNDYNVVSATVKINVLYKFGGFLDPIDANGNSLFKLGSTVPVKFQLTDVKGKYISIAVAKLLVSQVSKSVAGTDVEAVSTAAATSDNLFRYDSTSNQYIFNLSTKSLSKGTWQIKVTLDDGTSHSIQISLK
jgi:hypothetical protein